MKQSKKIFVTGGTGFIGRRVVERLVERGYEVTCLSRDPEKATGLRDLGVTLVQGDIADPASMRPGMAGADVVFHIAGWYEVGISPEAESRMERINVQGTENVLGLAFELGVPKIVYTSTVGVLGDTHGAVVDETYQRDTPLQSAYDRTKYQAHQIAERYIDQGAPVTIVMPTAVYGPGDHSMIATFLRLLLRRRLPVVVGADAGFAFVHVDDVATGHVLAAEKGRAGQAYILGGDIMTMGDAVQAITRLAGVPDPLLLLDFRWIAPLEGLVNRLEKFVTLPPLLSSETIGVLGVTWFGTSAKAERELGYTHRPFREGMAETIEWELARLHGQPAYVKSRRQRVTLLALTVAAYFLVAFLYRWRKT